LDFQRQTQALNLLIFAKTLEAPAPTVFARTKGSKGEPLGAFLAPLLGARQEVASKPAQRTLISLGKILQSKILRARANRTLPSAQNEIARASVRRRRW